MQPKPSNRLQLLSPWSQSRRASGRRFGAGPCRRGWPGEYNRGEASRQFPLRHHSANYWMPCIRAAIALSHADAPQAMTYLAATAPYELAAVQPPFSSGGSLYPAYLRGQAYLANRQWDLAAAEFQKILDHPGLVWNFPLALWPTYNLRAPMRVPATRPRRRILSSIPSPLARCRSGRSAFD